MEVEQTIHEGLASAQRCGELAAVSALHVLHGRVLQRRGQVADARATFASALAIARRQGAVVLQADALELVARTAQRDML